MHCWFNTLNLSFEFKFYFKYADFKKFSSYLRKTETELSFKNLQQYIM